MMLTEAQGGVCENREDYVPHFRHIFAQQMKGNYFLCSE
jgi:hypothetical protein